MRDIGFNNPMSAEGDLIIGGLLGAATRLAKGSDGEILTLSGGVPVWSAVASSGDASGPASSTDNAIARFNGTGGKTLQNSVVTIADTTGNMAGVGTLNTHTIPGGTGTLALTTDITGTNSGTNTGDQTSIVGITGTKAQFDTAVTDGNILYVGDAPTAHAASHAVGGADTVFPADPNADRYLKWNDTSGAIEWAEVAAGTVDVVSNVATSTILGRITALSGDSEELTATQVRTLLNVENGADVTDTTNVAAAGAAMSGGAFHDGFSDFVANEHIDWTADQGATNIHAGNIPDLSGTYQPLDTDLTAIAGLSSADGNFIVGSATGWVVESGNTAIASLGITSTAAELNILDGATLTVTELNYVDGVTSAIQTQIDGKMANPMTTQGDTIYGGASGTPTRLPKGTAGQVLTMNAGATAPEWATAAEGGGAWTLVSYSTASSTTISVSSLDLETDKAWKIMVKANLTSGSASNIRMRFNSDGGATYDWSDIGRIDNTSTLAGGQNNNVTYFALNSGEAIESGQYELLISKISGAKTFVSSNFTAVDSVGVNTGIMGGLYDSTTNITSIEIYSSSATYSFEVWILKPNTA